MGMGVCSMINLNAFTVQQLQLCEAILLQCRGTPVSAILDEIDKKREDILKSQPTATPKKQVVQPRKHRSNRCPTCGIIMKPLTTVEGLKRVGCVKCRYSEVVK